MVAAVRIAGKLTLQGRRNPFVAAEGIPFLLLAVVAGWLAFRYLDPAWVAIPAAVFVALVLVFRDPKREIPASPLGVVSPVDGRVIEVNTAVEGVLRREAHRIVIRIDGFGTYTARCPVEGKINDLSSAASEPSVDRPRRALWVQTDEGDDVVLMFEGYRFGLPPRSIVRFGERLGQGARCAYLRLTRVAEVHIPTGGKVLVTPGDEVSAGCDLLARLPHP